MKRRYWLLPPLLALAGYLGADAVLPASSVANARQTAAGQREPRPRVTVEEALENSPFIPSRDLELAQVPDEELKERIVTLGTALAALQRDDEDFYANDEYLQLRIYDTIHELVRRQKAAACSWIEQSVPELRLIAMDSLATADAEIAWQAIVSSKRRPPCDVSTVTRMLHERAKTDPGSLKQACLQVPWDLFRYCDFTQFRFRADYRPTIDSFSIPYREDPAPWIESGAARALAEQGMPLEGFFQEWSRRDPIKALEAWGDWPETSNDSIEIKDLLSSSSERAEEAIASIGNFSPERRKRAADQLEEYLRSNPPPAVELEVFYPALGLPTAANPE